MRCCILHIGAIDHSGNTHGVSFSEGVNVITGRSSTGKSAIIEIFDYCFGSSDFTIPNGIITDSVQIYFVVLRLKSHNLIFARKNKSNKLYFIEETNDELCKNIDNFSILYFDNKPLYIISDFKKIAAKYFGIDLDSAEVHTSSQERKSTKAPSPSIRSLTSFLLQHQNLIANKHAIFYRFDEKEKRDQAIEHFKIFTGIVDQNYFTLQQKLNALLAQKNSGLRR